MNFNWGFLCVHVRILSYIHSIQKEQTETGIKMVIFAKSNKALAATFCLESGTCGQLILGMPKL